MNSRIEGSSGSRSTLPRVLVVADRSLDPKSVSDALSAHDQSDPSEFALLVPAKLGRLEWIGDSTASRPCAERQLAELVEQLRTAGLPVIRASVGDPEQLAAITDVLDEYPADRILLFERDRRLGVSLPWVLGRRLQRKTKLRVSRVTVPGISSWSIRPGWGRRAPQCGAGINRPATSAR